MPTEYLSERWKVWWIYTSNDLGEPAASILRVEDGCSMFLRNFDTSVLHYTVSDHRKPQS
jgi:hypothetical protein